MNNKSKLMSALAVLVFSTSHQLAANTVKFPVLTLNPSNSTEVQDNVAKVDEFNRKQWGLDKNEWATYKALISSSSPQSIYLDKDNTSPYRYLFDIETDAKKKYEYAVKEMAFEMKMMLSSNEYFETNRLAGMNDIAALKNAEENRFAPDHMNHLGNVALPKMSKDKSMRHVLLFNSTTCNSACKASVSDAISSVNTKDQVDIYVSGIGSSKSKMVTELTSIGIKKEHLNGIVSAHFDNGLASQLGSRDKTVMIRIDYLGNKEAFTFD